MGECAHELYTRCRHKIDWLEFEQLEGQELEQVKGNKNVKILFMVKTL